MEEQSLDNDEQINVRWAYDDPNPRAEAMRLRNNAQRMLAAMEARGHLEAPLEYPDAAGVADTSHLYYYQGEEAGEEPAAKRHNAGEGPMVPMTREEHERAEQQLAREEEQRAAEAAAAEGEEEQQRVEESVAANASRLDEILAGIGGGAGDAGDATAGDEDGEAGRSEAVGEGASAGEAPLVAEGADSEHELPPGIFQPRLPEGWQEFNDPATGHPYYVHAESARTTWARPHMPS